MGKTRDLFKEIKDMTGLRSSSCGAFFQKKIIKKRDGNNIQKIYTEAILI